MLQNPPNPSKSPASSAGNRYPNKPNTRHSRTQKPPQGHSNGSRAPHGRSNGFFYTRSRLPFARPQTLQNPPNPQKSGQLRREKVPNKPNTRHSRTQKPPQGHSNGSRALHGRSNGFLYAFKAAVCQASNAPKPSKPSKSPASSAGNRYPNKPNTRHSRTQKPPQGHSNGSRAPHGRSNGFLYAFKAAVCQASNAPKPSKPLQKSGQLRKEKVPHQAQHAPLPHAKATTRPQQWLKSTSGRQRSSIAACPLPALSPLLFPNKPNTRHCRTQKPPQGHSNGSRAPHGRSNGFLYAFKAAVCQGLKRSKTLQTLQKSGQLRREQVPQQAQHAPLSHAKATTRPQQWLKSTPRPQQWLLLYAFKAAVCQASNPPKPSQTLQKSGQLRREKVPQQAQHAPLSHAKATTRPQQWLKGTPRPQQWLLIRVQGCRLPGLKRSKTLQTLQKSGSSAGNRYPNKPNTRPLSHAKATTRPQQWLKSTPRPQQWLLLYAFKAAVCQASNPPKPSKPSKSPASSAGKRYPNKPNTRHSRTQKPPQGHSNGSRAPHGRSNGFL